MTKPSAKTSNESSIYPGLKRPNGFPGMPADWKSEGGTYLSSDTRTQIFELFHQKNTVKAGSRVRGLVVLHGMGEHIGRYLHVPSFVAGEIDAVYGIDHRGHGRSEGPRGHADPFSLLYDDVAAGIQRFEYRLRQLAGPNGSIEIHLLGHSLGGLISLQTVFNNPNLPLKSVTITAPLLGVKVAVPLWKRGAVAGLSKLWGSLQLSTPLDPRVLSHDESVVECYSKDRLVHNKMTPIFFEGLEKSMNEANARKGGFEIPLQVIVPMGDRLVDSEKTIQFFNQLEHSDKRLKEFEGYFHEPLNEIGKEKVFDEVVSWIKAHH